MVLHTPCCSLFIWQLLGLVPLNMVTTLEWFGKSPSVAYRPDRILTQYYHTGATTFRLKTCGLTIFLDTWLDRPSVLPKYLDIEDVTEADYIFISHAHFDQ